MRWTGLVLAVACTHNQPAPAPLGVPAENASGPAGLPDGGSDGGVDGGAEDGGAPRADQVRPRSGAGTEVTLELDSADIGESSRQALTTARRHAN
jgi:hypothetical protein